MFIYRHIFLNLTFCKVTDIAVFQDRENDVLNHPWDWLCHSLLPVLFAEYLAHVQMEEALPRAPQPPILCPISSLKDQIRFYSGFM